ncbi:unnamed protein product [Protopolystoma xenopodis]|uniref:Uncharacterized protein n=1 Tax=Protopolystoma xenopodis TaxID=117903 RepID=A0A3S5CN39_9PLAT|nr:unnamed protein product [Protopolystoma xenopodis]
MFSGEKHDSTSDLSLAPRVDFFQTALTSACPDRPAAKTAGESPFLWRRHTATPVQCLRHFLDVHLV